MAKKRSPVNQKNGLNFFSLLGTQTGTKCKFTKTWPHYDQALYFGETLSKMNTPKELHNLFVLRNLGNG